MQKLDLVGKVFNRLTVVESAGKDKRNVPLWSCACSCGNKIITSTAMLRTGHAQSCGCLRRERAAAHARSLGTHGAWVGGKATPEWYAWFSMRQRCGRTTHIQYPDYGGRGIAVCPEWGEFSKFLEDMGPRPSRAHSLDRVDNNKGYCKANCRWATRTEQNNNTRACRPITVGGRTLTVSQWARELNMTRGTLVGRIGKYPTREEAIAALLAAQQSIKPDEL